MFKKLKSLIFKPEPIRGCQTPMEELQLKAILGDMAYKSENVLGLHVQDVDPEELTLEETAQYCSVYYGNMIETDPLDGDNGFAMVPTINVNEESALLDIPNDVPLKKVQN